MSEPSNEQPDPLFRVVHRYTRAQAIADGVLVDVSELAREAGFAWPLAVTAEVWGLVQAIPEAHRHEDATGRLWDVLMVAWANVRYGKGDGQELRFGVILHHEGGDRLELKLVAGPGDEGEPVLTLMLPEQD